MPIQPFFDFTKVPLMKRPTNETFGNLLENAFGQYQSGQQFKEEQKKRTLSNEEQALANSLMKKYGEERQRAEIDFLKTNAPEAEQRIQKMKLENNILNRTGLPDAQAHLRYKQAQAIREEQAQDEVIRLQSEREDAVKKWGEGSPQVDQIDDYLDKITTNITKRAGISDAQRRFTSLTPTQKESLMARYRPAFNDLEIAQHIGEGWNDFDFVDAAKEKGVDLNTTEPIFAPTTSSVTAQQRMAGGVAEIDKLEQLMTPAAEKYTFTLGGYSPGLELDAFLGKNEDDVAQYYAQRALQPELQGARNRITQGSNAHEALKEMQEKAFGNSKIFRSNVSKKTYSLMQHYMNKWIKEAAHASKEEVLNRRPRKNEEQMKKEALSKNEMVTIRNPKTGETRNVSSEEAKRLGAK